MIARLLTRAHHSANYLVFYSGYLTRLPHREQATGRRQAPVQVHLAPPFLVHEVNVMPTITSLFDCIQDRWIVVSIP